MWVFLVFKFMKLVSMSNKFYIFFKLSIDRVRYQEHMNNVLILDLNNQDNLEQVNFYLEK